MTNNQSELKDLISKRGIIKSKLTRFENYLDNLDSMDLVELQVRTMRATEHLTEFEEYQNKIELLVFDDELVNHESIREEFESRYFSLIAKAKQLIIDNEADGKPVRVPSVRGSGDSGSIRSRVKLPQIELPTFSGGYDQWLGFYDTFDALINKNADLPDIEKYYYLRSSLKGEAAGIIASLEVSTQNYEVAWELLRNRFENKKLMVHNHIKAIVEIELVNKESFTAIRYVLDTLNKNIRALKTLNQPTEHWDALIIYIVCSKLPTVTLKEWELFGNDKDSPTLEDFKTFLSNRSQLLEKIECNKSQSNQSFKTNVNIIHSQKYNHPSKQSHSFITTNSSTCPICSQTHHIYQCSTLLNMKTKDKYLVLRKLKICTNCLKVGHNYRRCVSSSCRKCYKKHNTILHDDNYNKTPYVQSTDNTNNILQDTQNNVASDNPEQVSSQHLLSVANTFSAISANTNKRFETRVLLSTAIIHVLDKFGNVHEARALLDSGSQSNFMTQDFCNLLQLPCHKSEFTIVGGLNQSITNTLFKVDAIIKSKFENFQANLSFLTLDKITERLPQAVINLAKLNLPNHISLADPNFHMPDKIDILLGASIFWDILCTNQIRLSQNSPILQHTRLGWVVSGKITQPTTSISTCYFSNLELASQLEKFWQIEECNFESKFCSAEEIACEEHFKSTHTRESDGRFQVALPFRGEKTRLGGSKKAAFKRLTSMERKFILQPALQQGYSEFMKEYVQLGHMELVTGQNNKDVIHYLPHHAVLREERTTTKLRCVFDGSHKTDSGTSLNELLMGGPVIQRDLFNILIAFRQHAYVMTADVAKMYRQIKVRPEDRDVQRILWRFNKEDQVSEYRLTTVTYGLRPSAFLAIRCLKQLAIENQTAYPNASQAILNCFYVDDLLCGAETIEGTIKLRQNIVTILEQGKFELRKWRSNNTQVINQIKSTELHILESKVDSKTLGLAWHSGRDIFCYQTKAKPTPAVVTKRTLLSIISQTYDPLGLIGPVTVKAKLFIQQLWKRGVNWDDPVPEETVRQWRKYSEQLQNINKLSFPRHIVCLQFKCVQLHGFADSSELAYGAVIYIRSTNNNDQQCVKLLCSKSKVAPLKKQSIPRLELCAALLLANLFQLVMKAIAIPISKIMLWSDSTITLTWIAGEASQWKTFIASRVSKIQGLTDKSYWRHIATKHNPADLLSRGITVDQLVTSTLWMEGPEWLKQEENDWPESKGIHVSEIPEMKREKQVFHSFIPLHEDIQLFTRFSSLLKLQRVIAYILRFKTNSLTFSSLSGPLATIELKNAMNLLIKLVQYESLFHEIRLLQSNKLLNNKSKLLTLNPFLDASGMLRVGGRLNNANVTYDQKHPIILPNNHPFTNLVIMHQHKKCLHAGPQALLAAIRLQFWIISGKNNVKRVLKNCTICFRCNPFSVERLMGQLPAMRTTPSRPFTNCGVDYAGPFNIKMTNIRTKTIFKAYLCIFVCFATKAVHLELVNDLTTVSFLNTLKRFISRRGLVSNIYSDNATNFVGAHNELKSIYQFLAKHEAHFSEYLSNLSINWHFIPARSPHMGGLWEASVKSAKYHLKRVVGTQILSYDEFNTIICQIEACLNSRPLCPISEHSDDFNSLTPGHFLIGHSLQSLPQTDHTDLKVSRLRRYQMLIQMIQHFWHRWSSEYLTQLQARYKWTKNDDKEIRINSLVLLKEDNYPPLLWHLGRVVEVHPGGDGIIRVVTVKTKNGLFKRAVTKLCPLPNCT